MQTGFLSLRVGYSFWHLRDFTTYIRLQKIIGVSWIVQLIFASETGLWSTEIVNYARQSTLSFDSLDCAEKGVGLLLLLTCWYCGIEYRRGHGWLSLVSVVCCHVEVSPADHSSGRLSRSVVCLSVIVRPREWGGPDPVGYAVPRKKRSLK